MKSLEFDVWELLFSLVFHEEDENTNARTLLRGLAEKYKEIAPDTEDARFFHSRVFTQKKLDERERFFQKLEEGLYILPSHYTLDGCLTPSQAFRMRRPLREKQVTIFSVLPMQGN